MKPEDSFEETADQVAAELEQAAADLDDIRRYYITEEQ